MREREEIIIGHPNYRAMIEAERERRKTLWDEEAAPKPRADTRRTILTALVVGSLGIGLLNSYLLLRESKIRYDEDTMQEIDIRLLNNETRDLRTFIRNVQRGANK